jgi:UDP-GlcNAc:undecaprenyl-phosphate/decaprenyl-phosphate GlcNAc-1-phosphate transferase
VDAAKVTLFLAASVAVSAGAVLLLARFAPALGLLDVPGGRKAHDRTVPLVGGIAIFTALLASALLVGFASSIGYFLLALSIIIAAGCWDDVAEISPRLKFVLQIGASAIMIGAAGVQLHSVGDLLGWRPIGLSVLAIPMTVFAVVGVVNAVNMMDGLDGLGGSVAFVAFAWYAVVAADSGLPTSSGTAVIFCGAIAGFLIFNLRLPWQPRARVFLGDAGSLMIGFALGWFAIDLTQGAGRTFPPIAALWILLLPLADCVSLMMRRVRAGKSPFVGDAHHIHHYLLRRGLTPGRTVAILVAISTAFGAVGYFGWKLGVPDAALFWPFFLGFFGYHAWIKRAWAELDRAAAAVATMPPAAAALDVDGNPLTAK